MLIIVLVFAWMVYKAYLSPEARRSREMQENFDRAIEIQEQLEQQAKADIYGGKTPEQTLVLFVEALRNEDIELASKYFVGEVVFDKENNPRISKKKWRDALQQAQEEGRLQEIADLVERAEYDAEPSWEEVTFFVVRDEEGKVIADFELLFSEQADIWQIESL